MHGNLLHSFHSKKLFFYYIFGFSDDKTKDAEVKFLLARLAEGFDYFFETMSNAEWEELVDRHERVFNWVNGIHEVPSFELVQDVIDHWRKIDLKTLMEDHERKKGERERGT